MKEELYIVYHRGKPFYEEYSSKNAYRHKGVAAGRIKRILSDSQRRGRFIKEEDLFIVKYVPSEEDRAKISLYKIKD